MYAARTIPHVSALEVGALEIDPRQVAVLQVSVVEIEASQRGAFEALIGPPRADVLPLISGHTVSHGQERARRVADRTGECTVAGNAVETGTGADAVE